MSKKFLKLLPVAGTITFIFLGGMGSVWGMWEELDVVSKNTIISYHHANPHEESETYHNFQKGDQRLIAGAYVNRVKQCPTCQFEMSKIFSQKDVQNRLKVLEDTIKDAPKANQVEVLAHQLEAQKNEIQSILLANQVIQNRVEELEQQKRIRKEAKEQFQREQEENIRSLSAKENKQKNIMKIIGYGGAAIGIGLLSWYSYSGI